MESSAEIPTPEVVEAMGVSEAAFQEVQSIIGRMPTIDELSTLLAMWNANGRQQSLYGWLKGQHHVVERHEYLYSGNAKDSESIHEPKIKECVEIAQSLYPVAGTPLPLPQFSASSEIFLVGNINTEFLNSEYAAKYLHLVDNPMSMGSETDDLAYQQMILDVLQDNEVVITKGSIATGGLFRALVDSCREGKVGFDILTCREVRLDAFLFGEEGGRILVTIPEAQEDFFLLKMDEAKINCCFLGRTTKGRVLVDGMDFGDINRYL